MKNINKYLFSLLGLLTIACSPDLEYKNYEDINPTIFPVSADDVEALVVASYYPLGSRYYQRNSDQDPGTGQNIAGIHNTAEVGIMFVLDATTEILQGNADVQIFMTNHSWDVSTFQITHFYDNFYNDISNMTLNIDLIENTEVSDDIKQKAISEIKCARGLLAYELFDMFGPLVVAPLEVLKNPLNETPLARLTNDEMVSFIEENLLEAIEYLPSPGEAEYGRFSQGLARMILIRLYLHEKRWADVIDQANEIMDMNYYLLEQDYVGLWDLDPPVDSKEVIWAIPTSIGSIGENQWQQMVIPGDFPGKNGFGTIQSSWKFYDSFEANDIRKTNFITEYTNTNGIVVNRNNPLDKMQFGPIPLKIDLDPDRSTNISSVDIIMYRYADVLLSKAEAIANLAGAGTQEAIDLINIVRTRAQIDPIDLVDYTDINAFNIMILLERSHEYWCENGQYRSDLIRHGKFKEYADDLNGASSRSEDYKVVFPFNLNKITEGKGAFIQNPGY